MRSKKKYLAIVEGEKMETDILEYVLQKYDFNVEVSQEKLALSNSYWSKDCNLIVLFLINSNDDFPYIIRFVNFVVLTSNTLSWKLYWSFFIYFTSIIDKLSSI